MLGCSTWSWEVLKGPGYGWLDRLRTSHRGACLHGSWTMCSACSNLVILELGANIYAAHSILSHRLTLWQIWVEVIEVVPRLYAVFHS